MSVLKIKDNGAWTAIPTVQTYLEDSSITTDKLANGAVTEAKLDGDLKLKIINGYVTPEMFGAKGDGIADDTAAVQSAFNSNKPVLLTNLYLINSPLTIGTTVNVTGTCSRNTYKYNLKFATSVKACIKFDNDAVRYCTFDNVGFQGTNLENQGLFCSATEKAYITLNNCVVGSFDAVFAGKFSLTKCMNCTFFRIAKALMFGNSLTGSFSYTTHSDLLTAINSQLDDNIDTSSGSFGEGAFIGCYISGQGVFYENVGIFVGGNIFDVKFIGCYIDYWSAIFVDCSTKTLMKEPIVFSACMLDSIITMLLTTQTSNYFYPSGVYILGCTFCRFNASFNSDVQVTIYDFMRKISTAYPQYNRIVIKDTLYLSTTTNAALSPPNYKFINFTDFSIPIVDCEFDFKTEDVSIDDIVSLKYWSVNGKNRFPILDLKNYESGPQTGVTNHACESYNGHIFTCVGNTYMNVNGTTTRLNN